MFFKISSFRIAVEGPSKAKIDFKDHKDGNCYVTYSVSKPGKRFSDESFQCKLYFIDMRIKIR